MPEAMTLVEYAKDADELTQAVVELYSDSSDVLAAMPYMNIPGGAYRYILEDALGGIAFRGVNESYTPSIGVENPQVESLYIAGGEADVDMFNLAVHGEGRRAREEGKKIKQMARSITDAIMFGDTTSDAREFDGLQRRLTGDQKLSNDSSAGGGPLSLAKLDELLDRVNNPTHIICNRWFRSVAFPALMRNSSLQGNVHFQMEPMQADPGRKVMTYNGIPILTGYEHGPDAEFLPFTEPASNDAATTTSSIYAVNLSEGNVCGIQSGPMSVRDLGELDDKPAKRTRIEWYSGMCIENPYAAARLHDVTKAAIIA